jgi:hypothetical protein
MDPQHWFWYALRNAFAVVACFSVSGILFQLSGTLCEKRFFLTSRRGAGIPKFSGSAAALVTLSISLSILNYVSIFTLSLPARILWTCCTACPAGAFALLTSVADPDPVPF